MVERMIDRHACAITHPDCVIKTRHILLGLLCLSQ